MELQEVAASCQANKASLEVGLHHETVEAAIWQASALAGVAYAMVQHVARPLWVRRFETEFPLDRFVLVLCVVLLTLYFCFLISSNVLFILWILVCRPFTWLTGRLAQILSSCRERFRRRESASTASTQPDPEDQVG